MNTLVVSVPKRTRREALYFGVKRFMDVVLSILTLTVLLPLIAVIAIGIKLDGPGPVIFRQTRLGGRFRDGDGNARWEVEAFPMYKFRTMRPDVSPDLHKEYITAYIAADEAAMAASSAGAKGDGTYKLVNDPRITPIGRFLRKYSLDEIPQLFNVLKGDMSLVGPRPPVDYEVALYESRHLNRFAAPAGVTGLWQVNGRASTGFEEMVDIDLEYICRRSVALDARILVRTIPVVMSRRGAG